MDIEADDRVRATSPVQSARSTSTPVSTVEALMYVLRRGLSCLDDSANRVRLRSCDEPAMKEIVGRLRRWKERKFDWLPAWSDADIGKLAKAWRKVREGHADG